MADSGIGVQLKVRQNAEEIGDYMKDLDRWQADIRKKDEELISSKNVLKKSLPPVRNQSKKKKSKGKKDSKNNTEKKRISSYDYNSWDKFNVDDELKAIDDEEEMETITSSSSEDEEFQEMIEHEQRRQRAVLEKDKGNDMFKEGKYEEAIRRYTAACQLDPLNAVIPANRAMALLKMDRYGAAEEDCTTAISIDRRYTKAYLRRATARFHLNKLNDALNDYEHVLKLEPANKQAQHEMDKLQKILNKQKESEDKSKLENNKKVPLKRIHIDEIGSDSDCENEPPTSETKTSNNIQCLTQNIEKTHVFKNDKFTEKSAQKEHNKDETYTKEVGRREELHGLEENCSKIKTKKKTSKPQFKNENVKDKIMVFEVPKSSIQLQADWKVLKNNPEQLFDYFKKINPSSYTKLFQQSIDSEILTTILNVLNDHYIPAKLPVFKELLSLSRVQRFGMAVMFLSDKQKKVLQSVFCYLQENKELNSCTAEAIDRLRTNYSI